MPMIVRALRAGAGLTFGAATAVAHVLLLVPVAAACLVPAARPAVLGGARHLARWELGRMSPLLGGPDPAVPDPAVTDRAGTGPSGPRSLRYLAARTPMGLVGGTVLVLIVLGLAYAATILWAWATATPALLEPESGVITGLTVAYYTVPGAILLFLALAGLAVIARGERALAGWLLAPSREEQLTRRVEALAQTRDAVVAAVDDERRRIERDLHDGVQQRLVALGMLLGRARRHPDRAAELVEQAHEEAQRALTELRDVSWRVYPAALDTGGLAAALESVAERAALPVRITCALPAEPPPAVRAAAWFVVCEAVTNAAKHSGASAVTVRVAAADGTLRATVHDDGRGGADPRGGGLTGLARRVEAADGTLSMSSPPGGPTVVTAELPCG